MKPAHMDVQIKRLIEDVVQEEIEPKRVHKFVSRISKMGNEKYYINIPHELWDEYEKLHDRKQLLITVVDFQ